MGGRQMRADVDSGMPATVVVRGLPLTNTERSDRVASRHSIARNHQLISRLSTFGASLGVERST
jgi:hypothetical protein